MAAPWALCGSGGSRFSSHTLSRCHWPRSPPPSRSVPKHVFSLSVPVASSPLCPIEPSQAADPRASTVIFLVPWLCADCRLPLLLGRCSGRSGRGALCCMDHGEGQALLAGSATGTGREGSAALCVACLQQLGAWSWQLRVAVSQNGRNGEQRQRSGAEHTAAGCSTSRAVQLKSVTGPAALLLTLGSTWSEQDVWSSRIGAKVHSCKAACNLAGISTYQVS